MKVKIFMNGVESITAYTTKATVDAILEKADKPQEIHIHHRTMAPIGAGYGLSGAGAIGAALALNEALDLKLTRNDVATIAHNAEVTCGTGLGDVGAQMLGGLVIGEEPGPPPYGKWAKIPVPEDLKIVCGTEGPLDTSQLLKDPWLREHSQEAGEEALTALNDDRTVKKFMDVSREFASGIEIIDYTLLNKINDISELSPYGASMVMLGMAVFAPAREPEVELVKAKISEYFKDVFVADMDLAGARLI